MIDTKQKAPKVAFCLSGLSQKKKFVTCDLVGVSKLDGVIVELRLDHDGAAVSKSGPIKLSRKVGSKTRIYAMLDIDTCSSLEKVSVRDVRVLIDGKWLSAGKRRTVKANSGGPTPGYPCQHCTYIHDPATGLGVLLGSASVSNEVRYPLSLAKTYVVYEKDGEIKTHSFAHWDDSIDKGEDLSDLYDDASTKGWNGKKACFVYDHAGTRTKDQCVALTPAGDPEIEEDLDDVKNIE